MKLLSSQGTPSLPHHLLTHKKHSQVSTRECHSITSIQLPKLTSFLNVPYCYNRMHCRLRNPKLLRSLSDCRVIFNNIIGNIDCSFFDIFFQRNTPRNTFLHCMRGIFIYAKNTPLKTSFLLANSSSGFHALQNHFYHTFQDLTYPLFFHLPNKLSYQHEPLHLHHV